MKKSATGNKDSTRHRNGSPQRSRTPGLLKASSLTGRPWRGEAGTRGQATRGGRTTMKLKPSRGLRWAPDGVWWLSSCMTAGVQGGGARQGRGRRVTTPLSEGSHGCRGSTSDGG